jgi:hypothetical protein
MRAKKLQPVIKKQKKAAGAQRKVRYGSRVAMKRENPVE